VASGLWGIENKLKLGEPVKGNAYSKQHADRLQLPRTLMEAAERLKQSKAAKELFGKPFVDHHAATRDWEEREFRKHVSDWELDRYFEII
jgi:glutamine synthetase